MLNAVISDFELRASDFRPMAGILALFFQIPFRNTHHAVLNTNKLGLFFQIALFLRRVAASSRLSFIGMGMAWAGSVSRANWL
jgi:hypothetical protein